MHRVTNVIYFFDQPTSNFSHDPAQLQQMLPPGRIRRVSRMDADLQMESFMKNLYEFQINPLHLREACFRSQTWNGRLQSTSILLSVKKYLHKV